MVVLMNFINLAVLVLVSHFSCGWFAESNLKCASTVIDRSIEAMGGEKLLRSILSVRFSGQGYQNALEQSERYEGPYIPLFKKFDYALDLRKNKAWYSITSTFPKSPTFTMVSVIDSGAVVIKRRDNYFPHFYQQSTSKDELDFFIVTTLLSAKSALDVICLKDTLIDKVVHNVIQFRKDKYPIKLFVNSSTYLVTATELQKPYDEIFLPIWGDSKKYTYYSFWELFDNGLHYPLQQDVWMNRKHYQTSFIDNISFNTVNLDSVAIPPAVRSQTSTVSAKHLKQYMGIMEGAKEIAKDVWQIPGPCKSTVINEGDNLILIEAPLSSAYSVELINKINTLYPGKKITTVITTSDAWLHLGGLREFVARDIKVISLKKNTPIIKDLIESKYISNPDALEKGRKAPQITEVSKSYSIKANIEIVIIPIGTEAGERMMMVYFPKYKLLYASDLLQPKGRDGKYFVTHYTYEVHQAVEREKLDVQNIYGMHTELIKYEDIKKDIKLIIGK